MSVSVKLSHEDAWLQGMTWCQAVYICFFIRLYLSGKNISVLASFKLIQVDTMLSQLGNVVKIKTQNTEHKKYLAHEEYYQQVINPFWGGMMQNCLTHYIAL